MVFPAINEEKVMIPGAAGGLESLVLAPGVMGRGSQVTIVCHPHSLMGGAMTNKVVHTVARARRDLSQGVVRFNFRGVGASEGSFDEGAGEQEDLLAVIDWVRDRWSPSSLLLAGFSFGAFVAAAACAKAVNRGDPVEHLLLLAPAVVNYSFDELLEFPCPLTLVYGTADEVVDHKAIEHWFEQVCSDKQVYRLDQASHFFHGRLTELKRILMEDGRS